VLQCHKSVRAELFNVTNPIFEEVRIGNQDGKGIEGIVNLDPFFL
jgi:hypothetical protein